MPRAKTVIADQNSEELAVLRRNFNNLLKILQNVCDNIVAGRTPTEALTALGVALSTGVDSSVAASFSPTRATITGVKPNVATKSVQGSLPTVDMKNSDTY